MLLNLSDDLPLYGAQRLLLSQSVDEFDVEVTLCINISEEYLEILRIFGKNESILDVVRLIGCRGNTLSNESLLVLPPPDALA